MLGHFGDLETGAPDRARPKLASVQLVTRAFKTFHPHGISGGREGVLSSLTVPSVSRSHFTRLFMLAPSVRIPSSKNPHHGHLPSISRPASSLTLCPAFDPWPGPQSYPPYPSATLPPVPCCHPVPVYCECFRSFHDLHTPPYCHHLRLALLAL